MFARQQAITKRIMVELDKGEDIPPVDHDPNQINQVLLNLLLNAIQSMDKPGSIFVTLRRDKDAVLITVADEGKGIPPENLPNIFRPFFTTKGHGTGLGLSLARRIVEVARRHHHCPQRSRQRHAVRHPPSHHAQGSHQSRRDGIRKPSASALGNRPIEGRAPSGAAQTATMLRLPRCVILSEASVYWNCHPERSVRAFVFPPRLLRRADA